MDFPAARDYIMTKLQENLDKRLVYHSLSHTLDVCRAASEFSKMEGLSDEEQKLVETTALFHDAGMLSGYEDHEESSAQMAAEILPTFRYSDSHIGTIADLIRCTRLPQKATTILEKIICDADLDYLGRPYYFINSFQLKLEWELVGIRQYSLSDWFLLQEEFLEHHSYFSSAAVALCGEGKKKNLDSVRAMLAKEKIQTN